MNNRIFRCYALALVLILLCPAESWAAIERVAGNGLDREPYAPQRSAFFPVIGKSAPLLPAIIPETTVVLDQMTARSLVEVSADGKTLTFSQPLPALTDLVPGEILVCPPVETAPDGLLRRVTSVSVSAYEAVVETEPAMLVDAIYQGEISLRQHLIPADAEPLDATRKVTLQTSGSTPPESSFNLEMDDLVLFDQDGSMATQSDQVLVSGSIEFDPILDLSLRIRQGTVESLRFSINAQERADLQIRATYRGDLSENASLGVPIRLQPITFLVGSVPVVLTPMLSFLVGIDGTVAPGLSTGLLQELSVTAGAEYGEGAWSPLSELSSTFTWHPPVLKTNVDARGYAESQLAVLVYGQVGSTVDIIYSN